MTKLSLVFLFLILPVIVSAQTRIVANTAISQTSLDAGNFSQTFRWYSTSLEIEHQFKEDKLWISGIAGGFTKEGRDALNGSYFTGRLFHEFKTGPISLIASGGVIYGLPGIQFDRTEFKYENGQLIGYQHISMKRTIGVPYTLVDKAGVLQPVIDITARKHILKRLFIQGQGKIRLAKFSKAISDFTNSTYNESTVPIPSVSIGAGFTF